MAYIFTELKPQIHFQIFLFHIPNNFPLHFLPTHKLTLRNPKTYERIKPIFKGLTSKGFVTHLLGSSFLYKVSYSVYPCDRSPSLTSNVQ